MVLILEEIFSELLLGQAFLIYWVIDSLVLIFTYHLIMTSACFFTWILIYFSISFTQLFSVLFVSMASIASPASYSLLFLTFYFPTFADSPSLASYIQP